MSTIRKDQQRPETGEDTGSDSPEPKPSMSGGASGIDKSNVLKSFYQRALDERDDEIERLKQDNQRLRAKIIGGDAHAETGDDLGAVPASETTGISAARGEITMLRRNAEVMGQLIDTLNAEKEKFEAEAADNKDRMLRSLAELDNVRRRTEREKLDTSKYAISEFARDVIGIGDTIQRAIDHVPVEAAATDSTLKSFLEGVQLMERELLSTLERHGVVRLNPQGERFDPNRHQAVMEQDNPEVPAGTVIQVFQAGYVIGERTLRPAVVVVAKGGGKTPKPAAEPVAEAAPSAEPAPVSPATSAHQSADSGHAGDPGL